MNPKTIKTTALVLVIVALVAAAAAISYYWQQRRIVALQAELFEVSQRLDAQTTTRDVAPLTPPVDTPVTPAVEPDDSKTETESEDSPSDTAADDSSTTRFAYVGQATNSGGTVVLSLDYADFLTGDAAAKAAAANGEESPPPNDYYISNKNTKLRKFTVKKGAKFIVMGADPDDTTELTAAQFASAISSNLDGAADAGYWFVIKGDTIRSGKEQWTP